MASNSAAAEIAEQRRSRVAFHRLRRLSVREIAAELKAEGLKNPKNDEPWTYVTVHRDCQALADRWRTEALGDTAPLKAELWAELREVRKSAWSASDLLTVLRALKQEAELLGLDAPAKIDLETFVRDLAAREGVDVEEAVDISRRVRNA